MSLEGGSANKIIVALDGMNHDEAIHFVSKIPKLRWVKVGLELYVSSGPSLIEDLTKRGLKIFLDLKFHDIPKTMAGACKRAAGLGVDMMSVHACAGLDALRVAKEASIEGAVLSGLPIPKILAVTVLTSWNSQTFASQLYIDQPIDERVKLLAKMAEKAEISGFICSPLEVSFLRNLYPDPCELVTPGIRPKGSDIADQVRVLSPNEAINQGASKIVIGRPITLATNPNDVFLFCSKELEN